MNGNSKRNITYTGNVKNYYAYSPKNIQTISYSDNSKKYAYFPEFSLSIQGKTEDQNLDQIEKSFSITLGEIRFECDVYKDEQGNGRITMCREDNLFSKYQLNLSLEDCHLISKDFPPDIVQNIVECALMGEKMDEICFEWHWTGLPIELGLQDKLMNEFLNQPGNTSGVPKSSEDRLVMKVDVKKVGLSFWIVFCPVEQDQNKLLHQMFLKLRQFESDRIQHNDLIKSQIQTISELKHSNDVLKRKITSIEKELDVRKQDAHDLRILVNQTIQTARSLSPMKKHSPKKSKPLLHSLNHHTPIYRRSSPKKSPKMPKIFSYSDSRS